MRKLEKLGTWSRKLLLLSVLCFFAVLAQAQTVKGIVRDQNGEAIIGATVKVVGAKGGTVTDNKGQYSIEAPTGSILSVSYVGYLTKQIRLRGENAVDVTLMEDNTTLNDVVVVGYGTMKKSDVTGSVVSVDPEQMMKRVPTNVGQALQGAAAGVIVTQQDGAPDANSAIRIRGIGTINGEANPLYVVDGVMVGRDANFLNPADIEKLEVLKDASATAIYGNEGANGVIMITTKHGSKGHSQVQFTADFGIQTLPYKLETLGIDDFAATVREAKKNQGAGLYNNVWDAQYDGKRNYIDWQDEMTRAALRQQYGLSASGGNDKSQYNMSVGYLNYDGLVVNSNMNRLNFRANVTSKVNDFLEVGGDVSYVHQESHGSNTGFNNNGNLSSLRDFAYMTPTLDYVLNNAAGGQLVNVNLVNPDGSYGAGYLDTADGWEGNTKNAHNPYATQMENIGRNKTNRVIASAYAEITFMKGLSLKSVGSYNYRGWEGYDFSGGRERYNMINGSLQQMDLAAAKIDNRYSFNANNNSESKMGLDTYITYNFKNDVHNLTLMLGNSVTKQWGQEVNASASDYWSVNNRNVALTKDATTKGGNGKFRPDVKTISYFGRAQYSLFDRYILTGTFRRDGSSNMSVGHKWGTFPSAGFAWRISEEPFMKGVAAITNLKFRAGWGQTGNMGTRTNANQAALNSDGSKYKFYTQGGTLGLGDTGKAVSGLYQNFVDEALSWETNEQTNLGLDFAILNGDLNVTLDWFKRNSKDLLLDRQMRSSLGFSQVYTNYGEIENTGIEFSLNYRKQLSQDFGINITLNGSSLSNKIKSMGDPLYKTNDGTTWDGSNVGAVGAASGFHWGNHSVSKEGEAVGSFYGYKVKGIAMNEQEVKDYLSKVKLAEGKLGVGDFMYEDLNGDGTLDERDMTILGNGIPALNWGLNLGATYKNWDFTVYLYGVLGQDILSYSAMRLSTVFSADDQTFPNILKDSYSQVAHVENGQVTNPGATLPRLMMVDENYNMRCSDAWVKNGDFLRISNVQIGYTFGKDVVAPLKLQSARLYASVQNLATISSYNKYGDPECGQGSVLFTGLDTGRFPMARTFMFGLNVTF